MLVDNINILVLYADFLIQNNNAFLAHVQAAESQHQIYKRSENSYNSTI